jgi:murein DD-endopeptidase MepM/ murein hydrolase activator NlpD
MKQEYFVVVVAHSLRGRLRRIHIPHQAVYSILVLALVGCFSAFGVVASYARMALKVASYNSLRQEAESLRNNYLKLQKVVNQKDDQLASLELNAKEVAVAYGIKQKLAGPSDLSAEGKLVPTYSESLEDYNFLRSVNLAAMQSHHSRGFKQTETPNLWPVEGMLTGSYGNRIDPFTGEGGEFHSGVDLSAPIGTPVRATADGVVVFAQMDGGYGRLIGVDHGGGTVTYYGHLSKFFVTVGQEVRRGEKIGAVGNTGRVTAPHLHYEVRVNGTPMNPYRYLANASVYHEPRHSEFPFEFGRLV